MESLRWVVQASSKGPLDGTHLCSKFWTVLSQAHADLLAEQCRIRWPQATIGVTVQRHLVPEPEKLEPNIKNEKQKLLVPTPHRVPRLELGGVRFVPRDVPSEATLEIQEKNRVARTKRAPLAAPKPRPRNTD
jgi:hypothetical protein